MSQYLDVAAVDEDRDEDDDSDAAQNGTQTNAFDDEEEENIIDDRIAELPDKIRSVVIKRLAKGGNGDSSYESANANDKKFVMQKLQEHARRKARQKKNKSQSSTPKKRTFNAFNEDGDDGSGGEGGGERDKEAEKKMRPTKRDVTPLPRIGLGTNDISRHVPGVGGDLRRVFFKRHDLILKGGMLEVEHGPFQIMQVEDWWKNNDRQRLFAERFAIPIQDYMPLRELAATDTVDVAMTPDYCSKALFAFMSTHRSTHLDIPRTPQVENICLPQYHCDRKSHLLLEQGPSGGDSWGGRLPAVEALCVLRHAHGGPRDSADCYTLEQGRGWRAGRVVCCNCDALHGAKLQHQQPRKGAGGRALL